ncbi:hypothetical protein MRB53_040795 [Persea americana]|nr:hypothetical protein MRB53_040795 [Persea americana]
MTSILPGCLIYLQSPSCFKTCFSSRSVSSGHSFSTPLTKLYHFARSLLIIIPHPAVHSTSLPRIYVIKPGPSLMASHQLHAVPSDLGTMWRILAEELHVHSNRGRSVVTTAVVYIHVAQTAMEFFGSVLLLRALCNSAAAGAYIDAKYHISKDVRTLATGVKVARRLKSRGERKAIHDEQTLINLVTSSKASLWYDYEEQVAQRPDTACIWYRKAPGETAVEYTWQQVYDQSLRYANFFQDLGLKPGQLVNTYLINSPEFMFDVLGCWAIGCAPAEINYNLAGDSLVHCLKTTGSKVLLADEDPECRERIEAVRDKIEALGMKIIILDDETRAKTNTYAAIRPGDEFRDHIVPSSPIFLFFTSGTTGFPKACGFKTERGYTLSIPLLCSANDTQGTGGTIAVGCMVSGVTLCLGRKFSTSNFWRDIHDSKAEGFVYVGETARYLLAAPPTSLDKDHSLKVVFGNGMRPDVWAKFQDRFNVPQVNEFFNSTEGMFALMNVCRGPFAQGPVGHHGALLRLLYHKQIVPVEIDAEDSSKIYRDPKTGFGKRNQYHEGGEILVLCPDPEAFAGYWKQQRSNEQEIRKERLQTRRSLLSHR